MRTGSVEWMCSWQMRQVSSRPGEGPVCALIPSVSESAETASLCVLGGLCGSGTSNGVGSGGLEDRVAVGHGEGGVLILVRSVEDW